MVAPWHLVEEQDPETSQADLSRARALVEQARRIVVLTGAGISTESGIADFRGPNGIWTKNPEAEKKMTLQAYVADPELRKSAWQNRLTSTLLDAEPNAGHRALVELERSGRLDTLVTQNIDGLHQKAGTDPALMVEIHGTTREIVCLRCGHRQPSEPVHERVRGGEADPSCLVEAAPGDGVGDGVRCGGILKPATISFGQSLVPEDLFRAEQAAGAADLLLAVGSTLGVFPAAGLVPIAVQHGAVVIILNGGPTDMDSLGDVVVYGRIGECLPKIVEGLPVLAG